jgi:hypothetical protein
MQTLETTDLKEVRRCRIAQFSGTSRTLKVGETSVTGFVRSVREDSSRPQSTWIITVLTQGFKAGPSARQD